MNYKVYSAWIFVLLMLLLLAMGLFPTPLFIGLGLLGAPVLVLFQAFVILRADEESKKEFSDHWYENL